MSRIAKELMMMARELTAAPDFYFQRIKEAISALEHVPIEYAWDNSKTRRQMEQKRKQIVTLLYEMMDAMPVPVTYTVYGLNPPNQSYKSEDELIRALRRQGHKVRGFNPPGRHKKQLWDQPIFDGLIGPMYDGPKVVRYETQEVYDRLSV